jgi:antitoxin (DNA-binding transcriptional repressor) of toxin-antitoxin stability system
MLYEYTAHATFVMHLRNSRATSRLGCVNLSCGNLSCGNLSRYIRRIEAGERISVTAHGRVVAELVAPGRSPRASPGSRWEELIAAGTLHPPVVAVTRSRTGRTPSCRRAPPLT